MDARRCSRAVVVRFRAIAGRPVTERRGRKPRPGNGGCSMNPLVQKALKAAAPAVITIFADDVLQK
jgi:hypothetical protein